MVTLLDCRKPLAFALGGWIATFSAFKLSEAILALAGWSLGAEIAVGFLVAAAFSVPITSLVFVAMHYRASARTLSGLIALYVSLVGIFANIDFDLVVHFGRLDGVPFRGVHSIWTESPPDDRRVISWSRFISAALACLHFSIETLSTFNDGEVVPITWYAKLVVDLQVLMGLGVTVISAGRHFAGKEAPRDGADLRTRLQTRGSWARNAPPITISARTISSADLAGGWSAGLMPESEAAGIWRAAQTGDDR